MKRRVWIGIVVAAVVLIGGLFFLLPEIRLVYYESELNRADGPKETILYVQKLLKLNKERAGEVVARYAKASRYRAFDSRHGVFLIHERETGETYVGYVGPSGSEIDTGDPGLDRAVREAIPDIAYRSTSIGKPPVRFREVRLRLSRADRVDFLLRPEEDEEVFYVERFQFKDGRLAAQGTYTIPRSDLKKWQEKWGWPKESN